MGSRLSYKGDQRDIDIIDLCQKLILSCIPGYKTIRFSSQEEQSVFFSALTPEQINLAFSSEKMQFQYFLEITQRCNLAYNEPELLVLIEALLHDKTFFALNKKGKDKNKDEKNKDEKNKDEKNKEENNKNKDTNKDNKNKDNNKDNKKKENKTFKRFINMSKLSRGEIVDLDKWIEQLKNCQPLEECQVKTLCEKVIYIPNLILIINLLII